METFLVAVVTGLALAATYAVISSGLVLTYTTTGVFNFAHGAAGMLAAFAFWQLHVGWGWPTIPSVIVVMFVLAPGAGIVIELLMRGVDGASETVKLVVSISLLFGMIGLSQLIWPAEVSRTLQPFFAGHKVTLGATAVSYHQLIEVVLAIVVAIGLRLLLYRTRTGVAMRAVVDDRSLGLLNGVRSTRVNQLSWMLATMLAAAGGILIASYAGLNAINLSIIIVDSYAAAIFGRLRSLPMTFVGAGVVGLAEAFFLYYLPHDQYVLGLRNAAPVVVLFIVLLALPNSRLRGGGRVREYFPAPSIRGLLTFAAVVLVGGLMLATTLSPVDMPTYAKIFPFAIIAVSLVPLLGFANQVSLCQFSLAGVGAAVMAQAGAHGNPLGIVLAMVVAAIIGALVALPALRLSGIYLALGTAAFAVALDRWLFTLPAFHVGSVTFQLFGAGTLNVVPPGVFGRYASSPRAQFVLVVVALVLATLVVAWVRRSHFGRTLLASRDSEMACATFGMGLVKARLAVFALSSAIAGLGGALAGMLQTSISAQDFTFTGGLPIFMLVVVGGAGFISAGLFTGLSLYGFFPLVSAFAGWFAKIQNVTVGAAGVGLGRDPSGAAPQFAEGLVAIRRDLAVQYAMYALMVLAWLARLAGVFANWSFVVALVVIGIAGLAVAELRRLRSAPARQRARGRAAEVPLEWLGLTEPWTPERVAELDRELALPSVGVSVGSAQ